MILAVALQVFGVIAAVSAGWLIHGLGGALIPIALVAFYVGEQRERNHGAA